MVLKSPTKNTAQTGRGALAVGGIAAILASTCCLGPLVLISLGISGAWISNLTALEPYRPIFIGTALIALFFVWPRVWRSAITCASGEVCAAQQVGYVFKVLFCIVVALVIVALGLPVIGPWFYSL